MKVFDTKQEFNAWKKCNPNLYALLDTVIFEWRGSAAKLGSSPGHWAAYDRQHWVKKSGLSFDQVKRGFAALEKTALIEQERHRFGGCSNIMWRRPTALAIEFMSNRRDADLARLVKGSASLQATPIAPPQATPIAPPVAPPLKLPLAPAPAPSDYTSFPSLPTETKKATIQMAGFGKGKAGQEKSVSTAGKLIQFKSKSVATAKPVQQIAQKPALPLAAVMSDEDDVDALIAKMAAKKAKKLDELFPEVHGPHETAVKHPRDVFPEWLSYSRKLQEKLYLKYRNEYIPNWNAGKKGKSALAIQAVESEDFELNCNDIDYEAALKAQPKK